MRNLPIALIDLAALKSVVFVGISLALATYWIIAKRTAARAKQWPTAEATIESGAKENVSRDGKALILLPVFAFSFSVGGEYYSGRFALRPYILDPGDSIITRMIGRKILVHYDPKDASRWFIADDLIEGCKVEQKLAPHIIPCYPRD